MSPSLPTDSLTEWIRASEPHEPARRPDAACRLATHGPLISGHGWSGLRVGTGEPRPVAIWELTGPLQRAVTDAKTDDVPSAVAKPIRYLTSGAGSAQENTYADASASTRPMRVYHVGAFPGDQRDSIVTLEAGQPGSLGIPKYNAGDRVYAEFNQQSGRWEILGPAEDVWRFELKTALVPNGDRDVPSTADAYLVIYDADQSRYVKTDLEFTVADFLDIWDAEPGCRGYARRMADSHPSVGWEVLTMETASGGSSSSSGT